MTKIETYSIYTLTDKATGSVFYVGCTKCEAMRRKSYEHYPSESNNEMYSYLHQNKIDFSFDVIDTITTALVVEAKILEAHWINHYKSIGFTLINKNTPRPRDLARQHFYKAVKSNTVETLEQRVERLERIIFQLTPNS